MHYSLPDLTLCNKCKHLGYCLAAVDENNSVLQSKLLNIDIADIKSLIPIRAIHSQAFHYNGYAKDSLQKAFDAFHQDDYETSIHIFTEIFEDNGQMKDIHLYLGISHFCINDYENASRFIGYYVDKDYRNNEERISSLLDLCIVMNNVLIPKYKSSKYRAVGCNKHSDV